MSLADELQKLATLKADGLLTQEEFELAKARVIQGESASPLETDRPHVPTLGETAARYYNLQVMGGAYAGLAFMVILVIFLIVFFLT